MALFRAYRYYLGATVYEIEADSSEDAYAKLEFAVHTGDTANHTVRMTHEAMLPALNEITTHVFAVHPNGEVDDDPDYVMHKARDSKLDELVKTAFDQIPDRQQA